MENGNFSVVIIHNNQRLGAQRRMNFLYDFAEAIAHDMTDVPVTISGDADIRFNQVRENAVILF